MMRTIEVILVIAILAGSFAAVSTYTALPWPREVSPMNLNRLSLTTLQLLDTDYALSIAAFDTTNDTYWGQIQMALSASLPSNVVYNLTVYEVSAGSGTLEPLYIPCKTISNAESLGITSDSSVYTASSANVTFKYDPQKIGGNSNVTLYILNCSDAYGWWISGYTPQGLAEDFYKMLSPYFANTIMINSTRQMDQLLNGTSFAGENVQNATIINTCGECVPIPTRLCTYWSSLYEYTHYLGLKTNQYNWTWCSIVGYPFYYVSNTGYFTGINDQNDWGIFGMRQLGQGGSRAFLQGLNSESYSPDSSAITDSNNYQVSLTPDAINKRNYYGIYPVQSQTANRALYASILSRYNLKAGYDVIAPFYSSSAHTTMYPGTLYNHSPGTSGNITGSFLSLGLTGSPDVRITALCLLSYYHPNLYPAEYAAEDTSRIVVLQLGLVGGI